MDALLFLLDLYLCIAPVALFDVEYLMQFRVSLFATTIYLVMMMYKQFLMQIYS